MSGAGAATREDDWLLVRPEGEIDLYSAPALRGTLLAGLSGGQHKILIDLSAVTFMDSSGFAVVMTAFKRLQAEGGELRVCGPRQAVRSSLRISGLDRVLPLFADVDAALASASESADPS